MKYLYLAALPIFLALFFEFFGPRLVSMGVSAHTLAVTSAMLYIAAGTFIIAFIAGLKKVKQEQKYILYLIVLAITTLRAFMFLHDTLF